MTLTLTLTLTLVAKQRNASGEFPSDLRILAGQLAMCRYKNTKTQLRL